MMPSPFRSWSMGSSTPSENLQVEQPQDIPLPPFTTTNEAYAHDLYRDHVNIQEIDGFLQGNDSYDSTHKKWSFPVVPTPTETLVSAVSSVLRSILERFIKSEEPDIEREVINTQDVVACQGKSEDGYRLCPVVVVRAAGPSFQVPVSLNPTSPVSSRLGFSNIATFFSVKLEMEMGSERENLDEMASYARQIFHEQPNRFHVRSLVLTEKHARLVHFDRAGSQITPPIDYHQNPATLVRLVIGLSSTNERLLGLDDSIQWSIVNGRKVKGTLTTTGPSGETTTYPILEQIPTTRDSIRGRATTCWRVQDPGTSEEYVVKDTWRPDDRPAEHDFLEQVKGILGVVQIISHEGGRGDTKGLRCISTLGQYHNRVATRVTVRSYGKPLMFFSSVLQLLCAMRDAIAAHQRLTSDDVRIVHRDISHNNVLLGKENAPVGERGVIIDFDMSFKSTDEHPSVKVQHNIGTRLFQSTSVVGSFSTGKEPPAYDYLDDLESFIYLLAYVFLLYRPDGSRVPTTEKGPSIVWSLGDEDPDTAHMNKYRLYGVGAVATTALRLIQDAWGPVCRKLFHTFSWWMLDILGEKETLLYGSKSTGGPAAVPPLHSRRDEHYSAVLKMFDEAIDTLRKEDPVVGPPPASNSGTESSNPPQALPANPVAATFGATASMAVCMTEDPALDAEGAAIQAPPTKRRPATIPSISTPSPYTTQPRRSARIRDVHPQNQTSQQPSIVKPSRPIQPQLSASALPAIPPRRSARIQKRRLEEEEHSKAPPLKTRRIKKVAPRVTARSR